MFLQNLNSALFGLGYTKNYFNFTEIFVLRLFKMAVNQTKCSIVEHKSIIDFLVADKCKPCKIYHT